MTVRSNSKRTETYRFGKFAERIAEGYFLLRGYRAVSRRWKSPVGEIDLIVVGRRQLIFVEVKARRSSNEPFQLHPNQVARLQNAAQLFLAKHQQFASYEARLDVIFISPWRMPVHIIQAI